MIWYFFVLGKYFFFKEFLIFDFGYLVVMNIDKFVVKNDICLKCFINLSIRRLRLL